MAEDIKTEEKEPEPKKLKDGFIIYAAMRKQGHTQVKASELAGYSPGNATHLETRLTKMTIKGDITLQNAAQRNLKKIINGKTFGTIDKISAGAALEAIKMVKDRTEPVIKQTVNLNVNAEAVPIDLNAYRAESENDPQDIAAPDEVVDVETYPEKESMESIG